MKNLFHLLISFVIFSVIFFSINYFIPIFRKEQDAGKLLLKTVIAGIVYAIVVTLLTSRRKKNDEEK